MNEARITRSTLFCPRCLVTVRPPATYAGSLVRCRSCKAVFRLPRPGSTTIERLQPRLARGSN